VFTADAWNKHPLVGPGMYPHRTPRFASMVSAPVSEARDPASRHFWSGDYYRRSPRKLLRLN